MSFEQVRIRKEAKDKLKALADLEARSMANMLEVLVDIDYVRKFPPQAPERPQIKPGGRLKEITKGIPGREVAEMVYRKELRAKRKMIFDMHQQLVANPIKTERKS